MKKKLVFVVLLGFLAVSVGCQFNENAPANVVECTAGNVQGRNLSKCLKEMQTLLWLSLGLASSGGSGGQTVTVTKYVYSGTLTDSSGQALSGATLTSEPAGITATTDENGNFSFTGASGTYSVTATDANGDTIGVFSVEIGQDGSAVTTEVVSGTFSVAVTAGPTASTTKEITSFYFASQSAIGSIDGTGITVTVPYSTDVTGLVPTISHNGASVSPASGTAQNFSSPVSYTVTAADGSTQVYTVAVTVASASLPSTVATPVFNVSSGTYYSDQSISLSCSESGAYIYYTIDGSEPTPASTYYHSPVTVSGDGTTVTIKAIAIKSGMTDSSVASATYTIDKTVPSITVNAIATPYLSNNSGAIQSKDVNWSSNRNGSYSIKTGSTDCSDGTSIATGTATAGNTGTVTVNASSLTVGANTIRVCVVDAITSQTGSNTFTLTRDDTAPTVTPTPGTTSSATAINISLACSDASSGCDTIAYTSDGSDPAITGTTAIITNGSQYSSQLTPSDNSVTTYRYIARDQAGNVATVSSSVYTVDTSVATVSVNSVTPSTAIVDGSTGPVFNWQANEAGTYSIKIGGTDCTNATAASGSNVSGSNSTTAISTTINNSDLVGGANTIRICVQNLVGNYGFTTRSITKDTTAPTAGNGGSITTADVAQTTLTLNWTKATDNVTAQGSLQYKVVRSLSDNISTVADAEANGTTIQDWTNDIATKNVTGLTANTTYYFNVLVKDGVENKGVYVVKSVTTLPVGYTIGGTISGLTSSGLVLQNNSGDNLTVNSGASDFTFNTPIASGATYSVTIQTQPTALSCSVFTATGTVASSNITSVNVRCSSVSETYTWGTFTDQFNGTIRFDGVSGTFGGNTYSAQTLYFMKCSQSVSGQPPLYNSGTNNCEGTAGTYQFCNENDNDCNGGVNDGTLGDLINNGSSTAFTTCDTLNFAGRTDWRVPSKNELKTLIHCTDKTMPNDYPAAHYYCGNGNYASPTVNNLFPNTRSSRYWSSSTYVGSTSNAWGVNFNDGSAYSSFKTSSSYVRCVSGP